MLVAIHQPNFLPRPKVLDKILSADLTIWLDNVQYVRREWQNRALVRDSSGGHHWLSVPVLNRDIGAGVDCGVPRRGIRSMGTSPSGDSPAFLFQVAVDWGV